MIYFYEVRYNVIEMYSQSLAVYGKREAIPASRPTRWSRGVRFLPIISGFGDWWEFGDSFACSAFHNQTAPGNHMFTPALNTCH